MKKILIMVLSFQDEPYGSLMRAQQATWDSIPHEDVDVLYYYGGCENKIADYKLVKEGSAEICFNCTDEYFYMSSKLKLALEFVALSRYDLVFRTNSSSYCNKQRLFEFAETLPTEKLYAGWATHDSNSEDKGDMISGAGIWLSRDAAEILMNEIDPEFEMEEDVYCSRILRQHGIVPIDSKTRYDVHAIDSNIPLDLYHYRFKTGDRLQDAENMRRLHQKILNNG